MCGIFGLIQSGLSSSDLDRAITATHTLRHRGPDDWGVVALTPEGCARDLQIRHPDGRLRILSGCPPYSIVLGHRRLSIIDLSAAGRQPMTDPAWGGWITYNGEIYNFEEIREQLTDRGVEFSTRTDTEVLLKAYRTWGPRCVEMLRGMFAFGIWDPEEVRLILARDRVGKKPLFYYHLPGCFAFASELKAFLAVPGWERQVNPMALHDYLTFGYVPGRETIFQSVWKLPPGHLLIWDGRGIHMEEYWNAEAKFSVPENPARSEETWLKEVRRLLADSVKARLVGDVPLGAFLSGGIDSSAVVGYMSRSLGHRVKTFSIGFHEDSFNELEYARAVARHFDTDHHEYIVDPGAADLLPELAWYLDEPFADASVLPTYLLARLAREHVKVILTGDGGDESFAGYESYLAEQYVELYGRVPNVLRRAMELLLFCTPESSARNSVLRRAKRFVEKAACRPEYREWRMIFPNEVKTALYTSDLRAVMGVVDSLERRARAFEATGRFDWVTRLQLLDFWIYLPDDLMVKTDRATMAHGLEARCPFLDHMLIERCAEMPASRKVCGWNTKYILKAALNGFIPREILGRRKQGFAVPVSHWFRRDLRDMARDLLLSGPSLNRGYFRRGSLEDLLSAHARGSADHGHKLWALINLELWHRRFIDTAMPSHSEPSGRIEVHR